MMHEDDFLEAAYEDANGGEVDTAAELDEEDDGANPYGACLSGHAYFRGGCPDCSADMFC